MLLELRPGDPRFIGPYRLLGRLGDGGMGQVFLGLSAGGRRVAVKVIRAELAADPEFRLRFRREVEAARKVSGLFTATVADADTEAAQPWLATAYVEGPSLAEAVRENGPLPLSSVLTLAAGLAESLAAIHGADVVHRDLKPANVLLGKDGPCVIDFGISRATEATSLTQAGFVIGSPGFMSPEQAEGDQVGPPSDIFSLGAVLAFAARGEPPFGSGSGTALVYRVVHSTARLDGVPDQIRPLIERCLSKDPSQRPTASELLAGVGAIRPMRGPLRAPAAGPLPEGPGPAAAGVQAALRPRFPRPLILGAAAASLLIAAVATWLTTASGGHDHPTAGSSHEGAAVVAPPEASASAQPSASRSQRSAGARTRPTRASSSGPSATQSATPDATMSARAKPSASAPSSKPAGAPKYSFTYSGASEDSCADLGSVSSAAGGSPVQFTFADNGSASVLIASIDANGVLTPQGDIGQGASVSENTSTGDYWVVEKPAGGCLAVFEIDGEGRVAVG